MQDRHLYWPPFFFLGPAVAPHFFNSRIGVGYFSGRQFDNGFATVRRDDIYFTTLL